MKASFANRASLFLACISLSLAALLMIAGCTSSGRHAIDYNGEESAYNDPPKTAVAGDEVEITCIMEVSDASLEFYVDGGPAKTAPIPTGGYVITFTMPDHDVTVEYRIRPATDGAGA